MFPNPNTGSFILTGTLNTTDNNEVDIEVSDVLGRVVYSGAARPQNGTLKEDIKLAGDIAPGNYLLRVKTATGMQAFHFVVSK